MSNAQIAAELHVTETTAKSHVASLLAKLGVGDRAHAVIRAYECGFVQPRHSWSAKHLTAGGLIPAQPGSGNATQVAAGCVAARPAQTG